MHGDAQVPISSAAATPAPAPRPTRKPGRPATYVFDKPDHLLTEKELKLKTAIEKRRARQNRSYHRRKIARNRALATPSHESSHLAPSVPTHSASLTSWPTSQSPPNAASHSPPAPRLVPGFSQNPLDLLATTSSFGPVSSPSLQVASDAAQVAAAAAAAATAAVESSRVVPSVKSVVAPDQVSTRPVMPFRESEMQDVSQSPATGLLSEVEGVDGTIELDATATSLDMATFSFGLKAKEEEDEEEATDVLVNSALVAAKEYANSAVSLKDTIDKEHELRRMTGIKQIVFDNLRSKYQSMAPQIQNALRHFVIFPRSFNLRAAVSVAGFEESQYIAMQGMIDSMIQANFITTAKGRYELNEAARLFLNEDQAVVNDNITDGTYDVAQNRFINHYRTQLSRLQDDNIHKVGWLREQAMALYDSERENMEFSEYLLGGRQVELREFLSAGITVMRYCVSAANRERALRKALQDDETSTENIFLALGEDQSKEDTESATTSDTNKSKKPGECDKSHKARLQLALSEAYFDQLKSQDAEKPLLQALKLMGDLAPKCGTPSSGVVDSVLVLLLLSNLRLSSNRIREARILCIKALKILAEAKLGRSTFGINAMSNLVTIYLEDRNLDKAKSVASKLLDTLNTMRYTGMPIYADALGVCAMVSMAEGNYQEAERQFGTALETVGKWGSKEWTGIPVQHCLDLDLWLMEGLADAIRRQGRVEEANVLEQRATEDRETRGLPRTAQGLGDVSSGQQESSSSPGDSLPKLRHLY